VASGIVAYDKDSESGVGIGEVILAFPSSKQAKKFMAASRAATRTCRSYETTSGKTAVTRLSVPRLGDDVIGERTTTTESPTGSSDSGPRAPGLVVETAFVRRGNHIVMLSRWGPKGDVDELRAFAETALARLDDALGAAPRSTDSETSGDSGASNTPLDAVQAWLAGDGQSFGGDCADAGAESLDAFCTNSVTQEGDLQVYELYLDPSGVLILKIGLVDGTWTVREKCESNVEGPPCVQVG